MQKSLSIAIQLFRVTERNKCNISEKLEKCLWESADLLRANSNFASNEYFMPIMGLKLNIDTILKKIRNWSFERNILTQVVAANEIPIGEMDLRVEGLSVEAKELFREICSVAIRVKKKK